MIEEPCKLSTGRIEVLGDPAIVQSNPWPVWIRFVFYGCGEMLGPTMGLIADLGSIRD
jgi:hypothetical protein